MASLFRLGSSQSNKTFYYVSLLTHQEECLFGDMLGELTYLNPSGHIAADEWQQIATAHQRNIALDIWTILPNGMRALIAVTSSDAKPASIYRPHQDSVKPRALSSFVAGFKAAAAKRINLIRGIPGAPVWQRGYQEQRIDDLKTLERIRQRLTNQAQATGLLPNEMATYDANQLSHPAE